MPLLAAVRPTAPREDGKHPLAQAVGMQTEPIRKRAAATTAREGEKAPAPWYMYL